MPMLMAGLVYQVISLGAIKVLISPPKKAEERTKLKTLEVREDFILAFNLGRFCELGYVNLR